MTMTPTLFRRSLPAIALLALTVPFAAAETGETEFGDAYHDSGACWHGKMLHAERSIDAWNEATGENLRNFPPDRLVDYEHMKLQMRFDELEKMRFEATETLQFTPLGRGTDHLKLNAVGLDIHAVRMGGRDVEFYHDGEVLTLRFDNALTPGQSYTVEFEYTCEKPYEGMFFTPAASDNPQYTAEVHTQGQTTTNRHWFICHDSPNEQLTTELIVNVPGDLQVSSNGRLISNLQNDGRSIWHYRMDQPHVNYLVSLVIGTFDVVEVPHDSVPMKVWVPVGKGDQVMQTYGVTAPMIDLFERRFGVPYPYDRYDQLVVKNFGAGGMENSSVTTMYPTAIFDSRALLDRNLDGLIAHELCHQWTGDMITCKSWADIWLNEGWATYGSILWEEQKHGEEGYLDGVRRSFGVARRDKTTNADEQAMVSHIWSHPWQTFRRAANPYPKGASVLHMLRRMLGEDVFWEGVRIYMNRHKFGVAETHDFRYALEEASGLGLEWFFDQWCYRPGTPELDVKVDYDGSSRELHVTVEQKQQMDARTPAFRFTLPVYITGTGGNISRHDIEVDSKTTNFRTVLDGPPTQVAIDPYLDVLKTMDVDKPRVMWMAQARDGLTIIARHQALRALREYDMSGTIDLLAGMVRDENARYTLRNSALDSLAALASDDARDAVLAIANEGVSEARVRSNLIGKLDEYDKDQVVDLLVNHARTDESYATIQAAIRALAELEATDHADLIADLVHSDSQHQDVRSTALNALADLDDPRALDLAMQYATYGHTDRARARAMGVIADAAEHNEEAAVDFLLEYLDDPQTRPRRAAASALAEIGAEDALDPMRAIAESHPDPDWRESVEGYIKRIEDKAKDGKGGD